jgi:hypothetical protein
MFGLMRAQKCGMSEDEKYFRRLNYCGTCKTTGALFGQKARLLLNHDTVFLAEILSALSGDAAQEWDSAYQSYNCLNLPKAEMPRALRFAAATNVILAEFKLADHLADEGKQRYRLARNAFSAEFQKAERLLTGWNFPLAGVKAVLDSQKAVERTERSLEKLAFPTAQTTAVFFREGVRQIGRDELAESAFELGFAFGKLVYLVDAFEDYEKDFRQGQFNALRAAFDLQSAGLTPEAKRRSAAILHEIESRIISTISALPLPENQKTLFISRLSQNLQRKLKTALPVLRTNDACRPKPRQTFAQRWQKAAEKARSLTRNYGWQMPLVFLFVFAFALVAPAQTRDAKSARECFDLSFNLIALGAVFGAVLAFPKTVLMQNLPTGDVGRKLEKKRRWCDWCDCCDCDCCDCCEGGCDGCNCCSGCCDNCGCDGCCDCSCD